MNFNIYLDETTGNQLTHFAEQAGESRNAVIRKAVTAWLERMSQPSWPDSVLNFSGISDIADMPPFEQGRSQLTPPPADPLA